ncbi:MAG: hypothetical protein QS98_C0005G0023 [archaeon GW2011_AR3]|nr:MAG: hypothetical protein QS98_C0005G0023 [archaeon GW2011_AR3]MBS3109470.1 hypothetical protein [Candidatus Woesearchaeota archaeon]
MNEYKDKIVFSDNGKDIAIKGVILKEDSNFVVISKSNKIYEIARNRIISIERGGDIKL